MNAMLGYAEQIGARTLFAETSNVNAPAVEVYLRQGFAICGFDLSLYTGTAHAEEFALFLSRSVDRSGG